MSPVRMVLVAALLCAAAEPGRAAGPDDGDILEFTVRPSGALPDTRSTETLDEKLARRLRQSDAMFRHICIGCARGTTDTGDGPFRPVETLGKPMPAEAPPPAEPY